MANPNHLAPAAVIVLGVGGASEALANPVNIDQAARAALAAPQITQVLRTQESALPIASTGYNGPAVPFNVLSNKASASTQSNSLIQECAPEILAMPEILQSRLHNPGDKDNQELVFKVHFNPIKDPRCKTRFLRIAEADPQLEDGKNSGHYLHMFHRDRWESIFSGNGGGLGGRIVTSNGHYDPNLDYDKGEEARVVVRLEDKDKKTGEVVAQKTEIFPVEIPG